VTASHARQRFADLINSVNRGETRVIIEKSGLPAVALISPEDYRRFLWMERARNEQFAAVTAAGEAFADVDADDLQRELDRALAETRHELEASGAYDTQIPRRKEPRARAS
jgi:prevent-host-death family protein